MRLKNPILTLLVLAVGLMTFGTAAADTYMIDTAHSSVGFQIKHLAIAKVNGTFNDFGGSFVFAPGKADTWTVEAEIQMASVNTGNEKRDAHLKNEDFFDVEKYPTMTFKSTGVKMASDSEGQLMGELTMHGVTKPVVLDLEFNGAITDPWGNEKVGFSAYGTINRTDWGLTFNKALDAGGLMIGEKVKISLEIEAAKQK